MEYYPSIPTRLAAALILLRGEISLRDIRSLPFVENNDSALEIALKLEQYFEVEHYERVRSQSEYEIDHVIRLVEPTVNVQSNRDTAIDGIEEPLPAPENLAKSIHEKFAPLGGVELDIPLR